MRQTWSDYVDTHQVDLQTVNLVGYYLESRGVKILQTDVCYTDYEWRRTIVAARQWWKDVVTGTFADWA